ncbi:hypothetical protein Tco_1039684, partial [Tanacetum coccineum]
ILKDGGEAPKKRTTRASPATTTTTTTPVTNAQLKALIDKSLLMHWQHVTLTEAKMAKTVMVQAQV